MNKTKKSITYITAACKAAENSLLGKDRIKRMTEAASEKEALSVLKESAFGGESSGDADALIRSEERRTLDFAREYAPDEACLAFCLLPYDFYNAEAVVKSIYNGYPAEKYVGENGLFTVEELVAAAKGESLKKGEVSKESGEDAREMPKELINAIGQAQAALENGGNGVVTGTIMKRAEYAAMLRLCKHGYLKEMLVAKLDAINVSVCLRAGNEEVAKSQLISGGSLTSAQIAALCQKDEKAVLAAFSGSPMKEVVLKSLKASTEGKPLVELEKEINGAAAKRMYDGRYTEQSGTMPYTAYVLRRLYEIACVRTILSGKTNGLDGERIAERLKNL